MKLTEAIVLQKPKLVKFIDKIYKGSGAMRNPMGSGVIFGVRDGDDDAMIKLELAPFDGMVHISELVVLEGKTGQGYGDYILKKVTTEADKEDIVLDLIAKPIKMVGQKNIPKSKLKSFYKKHGFVSEGGDRMIRQPK